MNDNSYDKYLNENDQFFYDEPGHGRSANIKQDSELYNEEDAIPGHLIQVKRVAKSTNEDWHVLVNKSEYLIIKGSRFSVKERDFLRSVAGMKFIIDGVKAGYKTIADFKKRIEKVQENL